MNLSPGDVESKIVWRNKLYTNIEFFFLMVKTCLELFFTFEKSENGEYSGQFWLVATGVYEH